MALGVSFFRKRASSTAFRRPSKRPRFARRRRFARKRSTNVVSQFGNTGRNGYSNRRLNKRRYRRILQDASLVGQHYRSLLSSALTTNTSPADVSQATVNAIKMIATSFWTTAGGLSSSDFSVAPVFNNSDLTIRGGKSVITFTNSSALTVRVRTWRARTTMNGNFGSLGGAVSAAWDPSHITIAGTNTDPHKHYKFFDFQEFLIEPTDSIQREAFIKPHKVDTDLFNNNSGVDIWIYTVGGVQNSTAVTVTTTVSHNLSFTGDVGQ